MTASISLRTTPVPGDLGRILELHGVEYDERAGYGIRFEAFVARALAEFILEVDGRGRIWLAESDDRLVGCTAVVHRPDGIGQLRWVLVSSRARGRSLGRTLVERGLDYCREQGFVGVHLETTDGLDESSTLYRSLGFEEVEHRVEALWAGRARWR